MCIGGKPVNGGAGEGLLGLGGWIGENVSVDEARIVAV